MFKYYKKGFSILEMVIVVIIIGVLLAAVTKLTSGISTAKITATLTNIPKIKKAVDSEMTNFNVFSYKMLKQKLDNNGGNLKTLVKNNYFGGVDIKNPYGKPYDITITGDGKLKISTNLLTSKNCHKFLKIAKQKNVGKNLSCNAGTFIAIYEDGN